MKLRLLLITALMVLAAPGWGQSNSKLEVAVTYLEQQVERPPVLSNLDEVPEDLGLQGARLGIQDNLASGRFLGQSYTLQEVVVPTGGDWEAAVQEVLASGTQYLVLNAPAAETQRAAELATGSDVLLFNAGAPENALREEQCQANLLHTLPSRAMLTDALGQYLLAMKWKRWFLISGNKPGDRLYVASLKRTAKRYGIKIVAEKQWTFDSDMRRLAQQEFPLFTQIPEEYDILVVADEIGDFGEYLPYHTRDPRPVAGTQGLVATTWDRVVEQWGAVQLQERFQRLADRDMRARDYAAWVAMRAIGEAVTRTKAADPTTLRTYLLGDQLKIAGFKGLSLNFRSWNGQLRQTIPLVHPRALVSTSPQQGFLHPKTELDTLGFDQPESQCTAFQ